MKKILFVFLAAVLVFGFCATASAAVTLPEDLVEIGDEAFMNTKLPWLVTIPDGVKTIGRRAFSGSSAEFFYLPPTLSSIAPDAFDKGATFEVLPDSYAQEWCGENGFDYDIMRVYASADNMKLFPGGSSKITTGFPYDSRVSVFRWEVSTDQRTWTTAAEGGAKEFTVQYSDKAKFSAGSTLYVRCRALIGDMLLQPGTEIELSFLPEKLAFTSNSRAINADSVYLQWNNMGPGTRYVVQQVVGKQWQTIADLTDTTSYTVYGLQADTLYRFTVVAVTTDQSDKQTKHETDDGINLRTAAQGETTLNLTTCKSYGTAINLEWDTLDRAVYDVEIGPVGGTMKYYSEGETGSNASYYVFDPDTKYYIRVTARIADNSLASGQRVFTSGLWELETGSADPTVVLEEPAARGETVSLSWSRLPAVNYTVLMRENGGAEKELGTTGEPWYDVGGLDRSKQYSFRVKAFLGSWSSYSEPVTVKALPAKDDVEYRALLIGEGNFEGEQYAARNYGDVEMLGSLLASAKTPTGSTYSCLRRRDLDNEDILAEIRTAFRDADDNDVSLFFIATHGDIEEIGNKAGGLSTVDELGLTDTLQLEDLASELSKVRGTVIVWLGSCGSGAAIYDQSVPENGSIALTSAAVAAFAAQDPTVVLDGTLAEAFTVGETNAFDRGEFRQPKFYVLTAARYHEMSWGTEVSRYNFFPKFICDGATVDAATGRMPADANGDGKLTQHELFLYIKAREEDPAYFIYQNVQEYPLNSDYVLFVS